jgi:aerobic carbon-monoxide dehydrogenase medium subunit
MKPIPFEYYAPTTAAEALENLAELGYKGKILAGGQSLVPAMNFRMARPGALVDINGISELAYIRSGSDGSLSIGALARDVQVEKNPEVIRRYPLIPEVMQFIAHPQIRNRGTFCGSIAHADPAGQLPSISLVLNASLKILKKGGERWVPAEEFFMGPFTSVLEPDELLAETLLPPLPPHTGSSYKQVARQRGGYALAAVASVVSLDESGKCRMVRMSLVSVGDTPALSKMAPKILTGQKFTPEVVEEVANKVAASEIDPGTDLHATADYRRHLVRVLVARSLTEAYARAAL